jgi:hypothetical protein
MIIAIHFKLIESCVLMLILMLQDILQWVEDEDEYLHKNLPSDMVYGDASQILRMIPVLSIFSQPFLVFCCNGILL